MPPDQIGSASVKFETSCAAAVKDDFNKAVALLHSFWFPRSDRRCSTASLTTDPELRDGALGHRAEPAGATRSAACKSAQVDRADAGGRSRRRKTTGSPTPRERALIDAVAHRSTTDADSGDAARAHRRLRGRDGQGRRPTNPNDIEAQIFYALAVNQSAPPTDKTYAKQLQAAGILEPLFKQMPTHPGPRALHHPRLRRAAARRRRRWSPRARYASLAPAIPHALHMPSHTFTRVGSWKESIETNRRSAEAARKDKRRRRGAARARLSDLRVSPDRRRTRRPRPSSITRSASSAAPKARRPARPAPARLPMAAIPARYALERGAWAEAAALTRAAGATRRTPKRSRTSRAPSARRAAAIRRRRPPTSRSSRSCATSSSRCRTPTGPSRSTSSGASRSRGRRLRRERKTRASRSCSAAADAEDATDKSAVSPGPLAPARELYGFMLLEAGQPKEALVAFEATMKKEPNRFRGIYGAARAAEARRRQGQGGDVLQAAARVAKEADTERPELAEAKKFVGTLNVGAVAAVSVASCTGRLVARC